jgi:hypothetical protein
MRRNVWMIATVACLATAGASAQSGSTAASAMKDSKDTITVTGCLQPDTMSAANSTTGPSYKLTSVMKSDAPSTATGTTGTTGTTGSKPSPSVASAYVLDGTDAELKAHVGHKIEVTGTPISRQESARTGDPAPPASTESASRSADMAPRLKVSSVRMIASDCSPK